MPFIRAILSFGLDGAVTGGRYLPPTYIECIKAGEKTKTIKRWRGSVSRIKHDQCVESRLFIFLCDFVDTQTKLEFSAAMGLIVDRDRES